MSESQTSHHRYLSRIFHYKLYCRSLLAISAFLVVLFLSIGLLLYSEFSNYARKQTATYATDLMAQQANSIQNLWDEMEALSNSIQADQNISAFFMARKADQLINYHAFRSLRRYKALYPFIQNISLYNITTEKQLGLMYYTMEDEAWSDDKIACGRPFSVARTVTSPNLGEVSVVTLVFPIRSFSSNYTCCIAIDIQSSHLQNILAGSTSSNTYILGEANQLLVHSVDNYLPAEWDKLLSGLHQDGLGQESFYMELDGQKNLVSYCYLISQSWTVVSLQLAKGLLSAARSKVVMLVLFLSLLLIASIMVVFLKDRKRVKKRNICFYTIPHYDRTYRMRLSVVCCDKRGRKSINAEDYLCEVRDIGNQTYTVKPIRKYPIIVQRPLRLK